ncbi:hypothetical protein [Janthinobacterium sp.]|uniref:hypothetical protein n=1 Tax=Janthinobacterium sp. TaxID=1871054 RepID=UPI00293D7F9D|nr:hypothetical protein [Janthinobacterium sp.]
MKRSLIGGVAALALLGMSGAFAADSDASVQVPGRQAYKLAPHEFDDYSNAYRLDNGATLRLRRQANHYYTSLSGQPEVEIFAQAQGVFVSAAGARLSFREDGDELTISDYERLSGAAIATADKGTPRAER